MHIAVNRTVEIRRYRISCTEVFSATAGPGMQIFIRISLIVNIIVLAPVCWGLMTGAEWVNAGYGMETPARNILLAIYLAIASVSAFLLFAGVPEAVAALLLVQVIYKVATPLTVGDPGNPVIISNLVIAALHAATLVTIWKAR